MDKHAHNFLDLTGNIYNRLTVKSFSHKDALGKTYWLCECLCGKIVSVYSNKLKSGHTKSCGCLRLEVVSTHKETGTRFYRIWCALRSRCGNYKNYINIKFSKEWEKYENFKEDMYREYIDHVNKCGEKNTTIDRINVNGDYCKENCRWATIKEQNNNLKRTRFIIYNGKMETMSSLYDKYKPNISRAAFKNRLTNLGWSLEDIISGNRIPWKKVIN